MGSGAQMPRSATVAGNERDEDMLRMILRNSG